jgi:hypothetical protein
MFWLNGMLWDRAQYEEGLLNTFGNPVNGCSMFVGAFRQQEEEAQHLTQIMSAACCQMMCGGKQNMNFNPLKRNYKQICVDAPFPDSSHIFRRESKEVNDWNLEIEQDSSRIISCP